MFTHSRSRIMNAPVFLTAVLAICLLSFTPALAKKGHGSQGHGTQGKKHLTSTQKKEIQVMEKIMDKHQKALELALIGDQKTTDTAVKAFCETYATRMQTEITQLQGWLSQWYQIAYAPKVGTVDDDDLLTLTGVEFTSELIDEMIGAHMSNVAMEKQALKRQYHPELKSFGQTAIKTDMSEVAQLKIWQAQYNPDDDSDDED